MRYFILATCHQFFKGRIQKQLDNIKNDPTLTKEDREKKLSETNDYIKENPEEYPQFYVLDKKKISEADLQKMKDKVDRQLKGVHLGEFLNDVIFNMYNLYATQPGFIVNLKNLKEDFENAIRKMKLVSGIKKNIVIHNGVALLFRYYKIRKNG